MYSDIDTVHGLEVITQWLRIYKAEPPENIPSNMINAALQLVISDNIFQFGDTYLRTTTRHCYRYLHHSSELCESL